MKIRSGFVSNSSSASFIIDRRYVSQIDEEKLEAYIKDKETHDWWVMNKTPESIHLFTTMDNGYLEQWMKENLNLPFNAVSYEGDC